MVVNPSGNVKFLKGKRTRKSRQCLRNEVLNFASWLWQSWQQQPRELILGVDLSCQVFEGLYKKTWHNLTGIQSLHCVSYFIAWNIFLITSVRDCTGKNSSIFPLISSQNPERCIKEKFIRINTFCKQYFSTVSSIDILFYSFL